MSATQRPSGASPFQNPPPPAALPTALLRPSRAGTGEPKPPANNPLVGWVVISAVGVVALMAFYWLSLREPTPAPTRQATVTASPARPSLPKPAEEQRAEKEALTALKSLQSVTSVGVTYADYMHRVGDAKIKVDQAAEQIKDSKIAALIGAAMGYYKGVGSVWNAKIQRHDVGGYLRIYATDCQLLSDLIARSDRDKYPGIALEVEGVSTMMTCAAQEVAKVSELIDRRPQ